MRFQFTTLKCLNCVYLIKPLSQWDTRSSLTSLSTVMKHLHAIAVLAGVANWSLKF